MKKHTVFPDILFALAIAAFAAGLFVGAAAPWFLNEYCAYIGLASVPRELLALLYVSYLPFMAIWAASLKLCLNLRKDIPFCDNSVANLRVISFCAFFDFLVYCAGTVIYRRMVFFVIAAGAFMIFIISAIIRELVVRGIELKQETELTI